jgi:hypothetical protein
MTTVNCPVCGVDYIDTMAEPGEREACTDCLVDLVPCPNHEGAYDCTPFCEICAGEQHYLASQVTSCSVCGDELDQETGYHILNSQIICSQCIESEK